MDEERIAGGRGRAANRNAPKKNAPEVDAERLLNGRAWEEFCDALKAAGRHVLGEDAPDSPRERAEGFRYLTGLVTAGIRQAVDFADPDVPRFFRNPDSTSKWGAENADNLYLWTKIRSDATYRITGHRRSAYDFLIEVKEGYMQLGDDRNFATLHSRDLAVDAHGRFEIILSADEHPGDWLRLDPDAAYVAIRQFFYDWENEEPADFRIVRVGNEGRPPRPLEPARMAEILDGAAAWVDASARVWNEWVAQLRAAYRRGSLAPARRYIGGADDIRYGNDVYRLAEDEAMIIETEPPVARYWAFQLVDLWFQSCDYANRQTSINGHQAHVDSDGRVRIVISHADPGVPNWLDTAGRGEGLIQYRWIWSETNPHPRARVVPFSALRAELPEDTPCVDAEARREIVRRRQDHVARRERPS
jgi:hypothetical protein